MFQLLWAVIIGAIVGAIAKAIHPGKENLNFLMTVLLGIGGSFVATFLGRVVGWYGEGDSAGFIASIVGAIIILAAYSAFSGKNKVAG